MERLTTWRSDNRAAIANNDGATPTQQMMKIPKVIDRLADIEDILGDDYDLDRLRELIEADRDRRCVVLWCSPGDRLYCESPIKGQVSEFFAPNDIEWILEHTEEFGKTIFKKHDMCKAALKEG